MRSEARSWFEDERGLGSAGNAKSRKEEVSSPSHHIVSPSRPSHHHHHPPSLIFPLNFFPNNQQKNKNKQKTTPQAATAQTNSSFPLSQLQLNPTIQRATDAAKSKAGAALAAAETVPTAAEVVASEALSLAGLGYPNNVNSSCIKSSFEYVQAFNAGKVQCVSPCLFGRFPDSAADPVSFFFFSLFPFLFFLSVFILSFFLVVFN